ncbi:CheR family methyltransferase [Gemmata sp. JC717]|uniref:Probable chemoreceptor glutamine deamidase CheD n=1 Tax=Gemmata algarum TaxID=2975278 RepID=A0ABU5ESE2_9BACT|nr:CheR family methyltransferase [Gemmata algarum]MDY3556386.1 CheR family methyltransferase [Gemmata algarum]MDY3558001.1 methyltransferase domain-containing protein [Gemmata algarum]
MSHPEPKQTATGFPLTADEFEGIRAYLYQETGISLSPSKHDMVASRLAKRLRALGLRSYGEYLRAVRDGTPPDERQQFINCLTTNKTDFFREPHHFEFLRDTVIPELTGRRLRIWCAASSTGEEPYTLAITARDACPREAGWDVKILASDIDTQVLAHAERGVYDSDRTAGISPDMLRKHFLRGTGANAGKVAARPELREVLTFRQINLTAGNWPVRGPFDAIFCRNVVIYFDRDTQDKLLKRFATLLKPGGYLFMGHSENIHWLSDTFVPLGGTVYQFRSGAAPAPARKLSSGTEPRPAPEPRPAAAAAPEPRPAAPPAPKARAEEEHSIILGEVQATRGPAVIKTLLGSCVAACLWDPETGVGGMNHFSLPGGSADDGANARYGAYAMELLITAIMKKGGDRARLRAKVFGGGKVLNVDAPTMNVGERNAEFVLKFLETEGIPVVGQSLGGNSGRLVRFYPHTGQAQAKPLASRELPAVTAREKDFGRQIQQRVETPPDDDITLF